MYLTKKDQTLILEIFKKKIITGQKEQKTFKTNYAFYIAINKLSRLGLIHIRKNIKTNNKSYFLSEKGRAIGYILNEIPKIIIVLE